LKVFSKILKFQKKMVDELTSRPKLLMAEFGIHHRLEIFELWLAVSFVYQDKDKLEDMDISLNNIWFLGVRLGANTSNLNISKDIWKIVLLLSYYKNLGYWWPFEVCFMSLCLLVSKLEHFKKSCQKKYFYRLGFIAIFWKTSKTTQLWTSAITKPLDLQCIMRYLWKDNIQIFHLVPKEVMYVQRFGCKQVLKIMATSRTPSFMSDTSISSSLSLVNNKKNAKLNSEDDTLHILWW